MKTLSRALAVWVCVSLLGGCKRSDSRFSLENVRLVGGLPVVSVYINDRGPYSFLLDTGAGMTQISRALARELNVRATGSRQSVGANESGVVDIGQVRSVRIGQAKVDDLEIAIMDTFPPPKMEAFGIEGDIGTDFLRHFTVVLDCEGQRLTLDPNTSREPPRSAVAFTLTSTNEVLAPVRVNGQGPFRFILDTGSQASEIAEGPARKLGLQGTFRVRAESLELAGTAEHDVTLWIGDFFPALSQGSHVQIDGLIGVDYFKKHRLMIDYKRRVFSVE